MANSRLFGVLAQRVDSLQRLLPSDRVDGSYSQDEQDLIRSYRVLVHSEFEEYFEQRVETILSRELKRYKSKSKPTRVLATCCRAFCREISLNTTSDVYEQAVKLQQKAITKNHGIKEDHVRKLLMPLGLDGVDFDQTWLNMMNTFGERRGDAAHRGAAAAKIRDPRDEKDLVKKLVAGLKDLDERINAKLR